MFRSLSPPLVFTGLQVKESEIESGVAGCVKQLISAVSCVEILLGVSTIDLHRSGRLSKDPPGGGSR